MDPAASSEAEASERARCCRLLPAAPSDQAQRGGADSGSAVFWRPWAAPRGYKGEETALQASDTVSQPYLGAIPPRGTGIAPVPESSGMTDALRKVSQYRHPVRLFWPKSKCYDYLYQDAEALLKNFPIQATIVFYEDSDSEDEIAELPCDPEN
ncbi:PREDICTED: protein ripply2 [Elephantulus edwardii]|uniref:protein ripply2 n=1 Tax=Elephantulus edwardii TaxID=28737 RepID=UPI0003F0A7CE|nr:PREDICTED: protein ripply2 [Elephantulus edwardii]